MIEYAMMHHAESKYCYAVDEKTVEIRLRIAREDSPLISIIYGGKYNYFKTRRELNMTRSYEDRLFAYYTCRLKLVDPRLVYIFKINDKNKIYYYSEDGLTDSYDFSLNFYNCFQYSYLNSCDILKPISWMKDASFYQIFIDRFDVGNLKKDMGYINLKWGGKPTPRSFAGGDLRGIINRLSYIKSLGFNALYLTPIFKSISNHKYDISDYYEIDEMFGNKDDLKELIEKAHAMGMRVVLDAVFNHVSENFKKFQDVLKNKENSKYYNWFIIKGNNPLDYECFAACKYMPKLNTSNIEVQDYLIDVSEYWIKEFDIDGWRLDVSDEVSHSFWRKFRERIKALKPSAVLIGENWHDANVYLNGDQYDSIMNYAFTKASLDYFAFSKYSSTEMAYKLNEILMRNSDTVNNMMMNLLDSHDTLRFYTEVNKNKEALKAAVALLYMFPGVVSVYYGTENYMEGGYDPDSRRCMCWRDALVKNDLKEIMIYLSRLKRKIKDAPSKIYSESNLLIIERICKNTTFRLAINNSDSKAPYKANDIVLASLYELDYIEPFGFIIDKIVKR